MSRLRHALALLVTPAALAGAAIGVIAWGGLNTALEATNSLGFCISCHEMRDSVYPEYLKSSHYRNASGVRATCPDCHVPRDWPHMVARKIGASRELIAKVLGTIDTPDKFGERRIDLAQHEWNRMRMNGSRECRNCHAFDAMDFHKQDPKAAEAMQLAATKGQTCIDCHKGIAHALPDMTARFRRMGEALVLDTHGRAWKGGDTLEVLAASPIFLERPAADKTPPDGEVAALARLTVEGTDGPWLRVRIAGWRREGSDDMVYAFAGRRIPVATLEDTAVLRVAQGDGATSVDGRDWTPASLVAWIRPDRLTADAAALEAYGKALHGDTCGLCHGLHDPAAFSADEWIGKANAMRRLVPLTTDEFSLLRQWLQRHGADAGRDGR
jgi:trimethylamine-N-oxide reductase (cytochrome c), cytochrome c-type subunit TorC